MVVHIGNETNRRLFPSRQERKFLFPALILWGLNFEMLANIRFLWRREWLPTPIFLPGEFHRQGNLAGYSPWDHKELHATEWLTVSLFTFTPQRDFCHTEAHLRVFRLRTQATWRNCVENNQEPQLSSQLSNNVCPPWEWAIVDIPARLSLQKTAALSHDIALHCWIQLTHIQIVRGYKYLSIKATELWNFMLYGNRQKTKISDKTDYGALDYSP